MSEWKTVKLGSLCTNVCSGGTPKSTNANYYNGDIPWLNTKDVDFNYINFTEKTITQEGLDNSSAKFIPAHCVIVAMYGATAGRCAINNIPLTTNQACCNLQINSELADYKFIYHFLRMNYSIIASLANGGAQQNLNAQIIKDYEINLPDLPTQKRIAAILSALDDKIELNNKINKNLEQQAQILFKEYFLDNGNCEEKELSEVCKKISDGVHNTVIDDPEGKYLLLSCKNIRNGELVIGNNERTLDEETFIKLRKRTQLAKGDILLTSVGTVGEMHLLYSDPKNIEFQRSVAIIKPNIEILSPEYLYSALKIQTDKIRHMAHGAVQQCLFLADIGEIKVPLAEKSSIEKFDVAVKPMFTKIAENRKETQTLAQLRDTLLPKLMSGELKI